MKKKWEGAIVWTLGIAVMAALFTLYAVGFGSRVDQPLPEDPPYPIPYQAEQPQYDEQRYWLEVSSAKPFGYRLEELQLLEDMQNDRKRTKARARFLLLAFVPSDQPVQSIKGRVLDKGLECIFQPGVLASDVKAEKGIWSAYLDVPEMQLGDAISVQMMRFYPGEAPPLITSREVRMRRPEVYPTRLTWEPGTLIQPGGQATVSIQFNNGFVYNEAKLYAGANFELETDIWQPTKDADESPRPKNSFTGSFSWQQLSEFGSSKLVPVFLSLDQVDGKSGRYIFPAGELVLNDQDIEFSSVSFDPPPPFKYGETYSVTVTTEPPVEDGAVKFAFDSRGFNELEPDGNGRWTGEINAHWEPFCWAAPKFECRVDCWLGDHLLLREDRQVEIAPMQKPRIVSHQSDATGEVQMWRELRYEVKLSEPVDIGRMSLWSGHDQPVQIGRFVAKRDEETGKPTGNWGCLVNWNCGLEPGDWGPLTVEYIVLNTRNHEEMYRTTYDAGGLTVLPIHPEPVR